jgi:plastocyanin
MASEAHADDVPYTDDDKATCAEAETRFAADGGVREASKTTVLMYKYRFCPPNLTIRVGTTVRWVNVDRRTSHSVWFQAAGQPESDRLFNKEFYDFAFSAAGRFPYLCGPHGEQEKMVGHVTVTE